MRKMGEIYVWVEDGEESVYGSLGSDFELYIIALNWMKLFASGWEWLIPLIQINWIYRFVWKVLSDLFNMHWN